MSQIRRIGIDTSKAVFTLHCVDQAGQSVLQSNLRRAQMATFFKKLAPTEIALWKHAAAPITGHGNWQPWVMRCA